MKSSSLINIWKGEEDFAYMLISVYLRSARQKGRLQKEKKKTENLNRLIESAYEITFKLPT